MPAELSFALPSQRSSAGTAHGWCWRRVTDLLQAAGHTVYTPTLTGLGERAHLATADVDLDCHINDVLGVIDMEEIDDAILCGHSYGGQVITPVLDQRVEKFRAAVWLDAFVSVDGQSLMDGWPPERAQHVREEVARSGDGWKMPPMPPEYFGVMDADDGEKDEGRGSSSSSSSSGDGRHHVGGDDVGDCVGSLLAPDLTSACTLEQPPRGSSP